MQGFLKSNFGGRLLNWATGASKLRSEVQKVNGRYGHVIGTGNGEIMRVIAAELASGRLKAIIDKVFPLVEAKKAMEYLEKGHAAGKVVIQVTPAPRN